MTYMLPPVLYDVNPADVLTDNNSRLGDYLSAVTKILEALHARVVKPPEVVKRRQFKAVGWLIAQTRRRLLERYWTRLWQARLWRRVQRVEKACGGLGWLEAEYQKVVGAVNNAIDVVERGQDDVDSLRETVNELETAFEERATRENALAVEIAVSKRGWREGLVALLRAKNDGSHRKQRFALLARHREARMAEAEVSKASWVVIENQAKARSRAALHLLEKNLTAYLTFRFRTWLDHQTAAMDRRRALSERHRAVALRTAAVLLQVSYNALYRLYDTRQRAAQRRRNAEWQSAVLLQKSRLALLRPYYDVLEGLSAVRRRLEIRTLVANHNLVHQDLVTLHERLHLNTLQLEATEDSVGWRVRCLRTAVVGVLESLRSKELAGKYYSAWRHRAARLKRARRRAEAKGRKTRSLAGWVGQQQAAAAAKAAFRLWAAWSRAATRQRKQARADRYLQEKQRACLLKARFSDWAEYRRRRLKIGLDALEERVKENGEGVERILSVIEEVVERTSALHKVATRQRAVDWAAKAAALAAANDERVLRGAWDVWLGAHEAAHPRSPSSSRLGVVRRRRRKPKAAAAEAAEDPGLSASTAAKREASVRHLQVTADAARRKRAWDVWISRVVFSLARRNGGLLALHDAHLAQITSHLARLEATTHAVAAGGVLLEKNWKVPARRYLGAWRAFAAGAARRRRRDRGVAHLQNVARLRLLRRGYAKWVDALRSGWIAKRVGVRLKLSGHGGGEEADKLAEVAAKIRALGSQVNQTVDRIRTVDLDWKESLSAVAARVAGLERGNPPETGQHPSAHHPQRHGVISAGPDPLRRHSHSGHADSQPSHGRLASITVDARDSDPSFAAHPALKHGTLKVPHHDHSVSSLTAGSGDADPRFLDASQHAHSVHKHGTSMVPHHDHTASSLTAGAGDADPRFLDASQHAHSVHKHGTAMVPHHDHTVSSRAGGAGNTDPKFFDAPQHAHSSQKYGTSMVSPHDPSARDTDPKFFDASQHAHSVHKHGTSMVPHHDHTVSSPGARDTDPKFFEAPQHAHSAQKYGTSMVSHHDHSVAGGARDTDPKFFDASQHAYPAGHTHGTSKGTYHDYPASSFTAGAGEPGPKFIDGAQHAHPAHGYGSTSQVLHHDHTVSHPHYVGYLPGSHDRPDPKEADPRYTELSTKVDTLEDSLKRDSARELGTLRTQVEALGGAVERMHSGFDSKLSGLVGEGRPFDPSLADAVESLRKAQGVMERSVQRLASDVLEVKEGTRRRPRDDDNKLREVEDQVQNVTEVLNKLIDRLVAVEEQVENLESSLPAGASTTSPSSRRTHARGGKEAAGPAARPGSPWGPIAPTAQQMAVRISPLRRALPADAEEQPGFVPGHLIARSARSAKTPPGPPVPPPGRVAGLSASSAAQVAKALASLGKADVVKVSPLRRPPSPDPPSNADAGGRNPGDSPTLARRRSWL
ncbi:hypothetical protein DIPPA_11415 [Diplonema papillatum]|nr:hypothetical protein DIPPA_11415 [Diplonema papillatum]